MKIDIVKILISLVLSGLVAFGIYANSEAESTKILLTLMAFCFLAVASVFTFGISDKQGRSSIMIKTTSSLFFVIALIMNVAFSFYPIASEAIIISNGVSFLVYVLIVNSIWRSKM